MCVNNSHRSPLTIHSHNTATTPTGFAEIVSDDFPVIRFDDTEPDATPNALGYA
jgi:hypothetical protein